MIYDFRITIHDLRINVVCQANRIVNSACRQPPLNLPL